MFENHTHRSSIYLGFHTDLVHTWVFTQHAPAPNIGQLQGVHMEGDTWNSRPAAVAEDLDVQAGWTHGDDGLRTTEHGRRKWQGRLERKT